MLLTQNLRFEDFVAQWTHSIVYIAVVNHEPRSFVESDY